MLTKISFQRFRLRPTMDLTKIFKVGETLERKFMIIPKRTYNPTGIQGDDVLSTSDLVRFSELVSSDWLESALDKNHSSVGAFVDLDHIAPAYIDDTILTKATITKVAPRKISYRITTTNPSTNELIGICKHNRVIIRFN